MNRGILALLLVSAEAAAAPPLAGPPLPAPPIAIQFVIAPPSPAPFPLPSDAELTLGDAQQRMTVPVTIGARGPYGFIIDTGAERTVISRELAGVLGLAAGPNVRITAMTGTTPAETVIVSGLSVSTILSGTIQAPALQSRDMGAPGMLGIDTLQGHAVAIDFDKKVMTLKPSKKRRVRYASAPGDIIVVAKSQFGQLIVTDAHWRGTRIAVIIDTGSPLTVGNSALFAAITKRPKPLGPLEVTSATGQVLRANAFAIDRLEIGGIGFANVRVAFSDVPPFRRFGLGDKPALLLGMDALRLFRAVQIDFANREIRFSFPRNAIPPAAGITGLGGFAG